MVLDGIRRVEGWNEERENKMLHEIFGTFQSPSGFLLRIDTVHSIPLAYSQPSNISDAVKSKSCWSRKMKNV